METDNVGIASGDSRDDWPSDLKEMFQHLEYLKTETDLGCILIGAAFLESCLERLIFAAMIFKDTGLEKEMKRVLSSFYAKIKIAHAFGLIGPDEAAELDRFRTIRNKSAHSSTPSQFSDPAIMSVVSEMHANEIQGWDTEVSKQKYIVSVVMASGRLQRKVKLVKPMGYFPVDGLEGKSTTENPMEATGSAVIDRKLVPGRMWWDYSNESYD